MIKKVKILCEHLGEVSYTKHSPKKEYVEGEVDLSEEKGAILSNDNWIPVNVKRYSVVEFEIPEWLSPEEFCHNYVTYKYLWGR